MIPEFETNGFLKEGIYETTFEEMENKLGFSKKRQKLLAAMKNLISYCRCLQCDILHIDGSFVSNKIAPADYDACWDTTAANRNDVLRVVEQSLLNSDSETQKEDFGGEIYPAFDKSPFNHGQTILEYFQTIKDSDERKGIIKLKL